MALLLPPVWFQGDFEAGKYRCLLCNKEFHSESGVKYHINSVHSQVTTHLSYHIYVSTFHVLQQRVTSRCVQALLCKIS